VTHVLPTLRSIQQQWPETKISWIIGSLEYQLVKDIAGVEFIIFNKSSGLRGYLELYRRLKKQRFDVLLHMQISLRASLASLCVRAKIRLGFDNARTKNLQRWFVNHKIISAHSRQHVLDTFLDYARTLGVKQIVTEWNIPIPDEDLHFARQHTADQGDYVTINPCTSNRAMNWRNWQVDAYAEIIDYLFEHHGLSCVLTGGPAAEEIDYANQISRQCQHPPLDLVGKTSLKQLAAIYLQSKLVIAPDTGPMHIANAMGVPVIGLFATSNPYRTGPYNNLDNTVNCYPQALQLEYGQTLDQVKWGKRVRNPEALNLIKPEMVKQRIDHILNQIKAAE
ncbi:MAG: glycosyltransferase family 9 protein, partial [Gammaproteobacteria bacterium]|nr:glycosyltransferase family 9 protein [Gammaproteobacteria bacterium]